MRIGQDSNTYEWKTALCKAVIAAMGLACLALVVKFMQHVNAYVYYALLLGVSAVHIAAVAVSPRRVSVFRLLVLASAAAFLAVLAYCIMYHTGLLQRINSFSELKAFINSAGKWGIAVFFMLTLLQVVILPVPAALTVLLGVAIYGSTVSFIVSTAATVAGSLICFILGRVFGYRLVAWIVGAEKAQKYTALINEKGKIPFIIMLLFPFFPDDMLCMAAGLTKMTYRFFTLTVLFTRPVMLAFYSYFGMGDIIPFKGWGIPVWIAIAAVTVILLYLANYIIKRKSARK